jgi:hypothetical protein
MTSQSRPTDRRNGFSGVWTHAQARAAVPYVASIMRSLREQRLEYFRHHLAAKRLAGKPGRPRRDTLLAHEEAVRAAGRADLEYHQTLAELNSLGFRCLDAVAGLAAVCVYHDEFVTEYVYDLFDSQPIRFPDQRERGRGQG